MYIYLWVGIFFFDTFSITVALKANRTVCNSTCQIETEVSSGLNIWHYGLYRKGLHFPIDHRKTRIRTLIVKVLRESSYIVVNINIKLQVLLVTCVWFFFAIIAIIMIITLYSITVLIIILL